MKKKESSLINKIIILIACVMVLIISVKGVMARFTNSAVSNTEIEIALYVFEEDLQTINFNLGKIEPQIAPYIYYFSVANYNESYRAEVDLEYTIKIITTTNIPLSYELFVNQNYNAPSAKNVISTNIVEPDENGTYFRELTTEPKTFLYTVNQLDTCQLAIYFPLAYKDGGYQDAIESVEIIIESKQII